MRILVLDDDNLRHKRFQMNLIGHLVTHVRSYGEAEAALKSKVFDRVYLDFDLNDHHDGPHDGYTGMDVAKLIPSYVHPGLEVVIHSYNEKGSREMSSYLSAEGITVIREKFSKEIGQGLLG